MDNPNGDGLTAVPAAARLVPDMLWERAAGLLAGRTGCRVGEAHALLLQLASERGCDVRELAAEALAALEDEQTDEPHRAREVLTEAVRRAERDQLAPANPDTRDWIGTVQQVLDAMSGNHIVLLPLCEPGGGVEDFQIIAASPLASDAAGRRGAELLGLRLRTAYPGVVGGPVWEIYHAVLGDGVSRAVGPRARDSDDQHHSGVTVMARRAGAGLLVTWSPPQEHSRLGERLAQTERLGNLGWLEWDLPSGRVVWSDQLYRIFERDPAAGPLTRAETSALAVPEDRPIVAQADERADRGLAVDVTYRVSIGGRTKHIRLVADASRSRTGEPQTLYGVVQDVTAREVSRARLAQADQRLREHQRSLAAEHRLAAQLQQIILPIPVAPIDLPGLRVAVRYLPAEQANRVGGDWYHADAAPDGSVIITVGDVAGHGLRAATAMAQLRHALVALAATTTTDPAELLTYLNRLVYASNVGGEIASAVVGRYNPATGVLVWSQAGHPAPLRTRAGVTAELERPAGPLLGAVPTAEYETAEVTIVPGDLLIFYTDGLIEHRDRPLEEGLGSVIATLNRLSAGGSQQPLADLLAQLDQANPGDDTCIVAARRLLPPPASSPAAEASAVPPRRRSLARAQ